MRVEQASKDDIQQIIEIENKSFPYPWSKEQLISSLKNTYLIKDQNIIKGFMCVEKAADEVHILHMAVHPDFRKQGIGEKMMIKILEFDGNKFLLEVRESNAAAQKLYEKFGFKIIARRKNYYQDNDETALIMELAR